MAILTHACRYDKLIKPHTEVPLNISIQMDLRHIEAIEQLVGPTEIFHGISLNPSLNLAIQDAHAGPLSLH